MKQSINEQLIDYLNNVEQSFKRLEIIIRLLEKKVDFFAKCFITHLEDHQKGDHTKWDLENWITNLKKEVNDDGTCDI